MPTAGSRPRTDADPAGLLTGLVAARLLEAYQRLVSAGGCPLSECAAVFGDPYLAAELQRYGMAYVTDGPVLRPASPLMALDGVLARLQAELLQGCQSLTEGARRLSEAWSEYVAGEGAGGVRVLSDRYEINGLWNTLPNQVRHVLRCLMKGTSGDLSDETASACGTRVVNKGVCCGTIWDESALHDPATSRAIDTSGEQVRALPHVTVAMKIADSRTALILLPSKTGAVLVTSPALVGVLVEYFDLLWERAVPLGDTRAATYAPLTELESTILGLMARGHTDDAIARRINLSVRTVRRHIADIIKYLGVTTRFSAGATAQRLGWLD